VDQTERFALAVAVTAVAVLVAVASNRLSRWLRVPAPVLFLVGAAIVSNIDPELERLSHQLIERIVTIALVVILFEGGMGIGLRRLKTSIRPVLAIGLIGTFVTAGALAWVAHVLFGFDWRTALLLGTALAPTDPAVIFSVLGNQEVKGRAGTILEGESGANDPVGIALLASLIALAPGSSAGSAFGSVASAFALQMGVGLAIGVAGGFALSWGMRHISLPSAALHPVRDLTFAFLLYGAATIAHGSGFLAVFVAGILIGDPPAPYKGEVKRFISALASLAEVVAFAALGLIVDLGELLQHRAWLIGIVMAIVLAVVVRPLAVGPLLLATKMSGGERIFILWAGLKGAVPVLLGVLVLSAGVPDPTLVFAVVFVVVVISVTVQGSTVPLVARWCGVPMEANEDRAWSSTVRFRERPTGVRQYRVGGESAIVGGAVGDLDLGPDNWVSLVIRDGRPVPGRRETILCVGDEVVVLSDPDEPADLSRLFGEPGPDPIDEPESAGAASS